MDSRPSILDFTIQLQTNPPLFYRILTIALGVITVLSGLGLLIVLSPLLVVLLLVHFFFASKQKRNLRKCLSNFFVWCTKISIFIYTYFLFNPIALLGFFIWSRFEGNVLPENYLSITNPLIVIRDFGIDFWKACRSFFKYYIGTFKEAE